jgi:hypothetical protein
VADTATQQAIEVSCTYGRIKYELIEQMWILMIENAGQTPNPQVIIQTIARYDALWQEWKTLKAGNPWCATLYTDKAFRNERRGSIGELADSLRQRYPENK